MKLFVTFCRIARASRAFFTVVTFAGTTKIRRGRHPIGSDSPIRLITVYAASNLILAQPWLSHYRGSRTYMSVLLNSSEEYSSHKR